MLNPRFSSPALHVDSFWCARWKLNLIQWVGSKVHTDLLLQSWFRDSNLISWCFCILEAVKWGPLTKISPSVFLLPQNPCLCHLSTYHSLMQTSCHPALFRSWLTLKCPDLQSQWRNRSLLVKNVEGEGRGGRECRGRKTSNCLLLGTDKIKSKNMERILLYLMSSRHTDETSLDIIKCVIWKDMKYRISLSAPYCSGQPIVSVASF